MLFAIEVYKRFICAQKLFHFRNTDYIDGYAFVWFVFI